MLLLSSINLDSRLRGNDMLLLSSINLDSRLHGNDMILLSSINLDSRLRGNDMILKTGRKKFEPGTNFFRVIFFPAIYRLFSHLKAS